jgi:hypothetical protein
MAESNNKKSIVRIIITTLITVGINIFIVYLGTLRSFHLGWAIGCVGIISFFGMLIITIFLNQSKEDIINKDNMRMSITAAFLTMYFVFVALLSFEDTQITDIAIVQPVISHFTYLVGLVVVFYFASSSITEYLKFKGDSSDNKSTISSNTNNVTSNNTLNQ